MGWHSLKKEKKPGEKKQTVKGQFSKLNKELLFLAVFKFITNHKIEQSKSIKNSTQSFCAKQIHIQSFTLYRCPPFN